MKAKPRPELEPREKVAEGMKEVIDVYLRTPEQLREQAVTEFVRTQRKKRLQ
ncbi:MAG: hypothetical protein ACRD2Q_07395 [Terriglobales bacterium]